MRVAVLGGTKFIGVAIAEELLAGGHDVLVVHRGRTEAADGPQVAHAHLDRHDVSGVRAALDGFAAEAVVDTNAYTRRDAQEGVAALGGRPAVALSSCDVYRAFATLRAEGPATDPLPLTEDAPVRGPGQRYLFRGETHPLGLDTDDYENLDIEQVYLGSGATVLRLTMIYGERDPMGREEFILSRVRAGRPRIPIGAGTFLWSRCWVRDVAVAARLAVESGAGAGQVLNVAESRTWSVEQWAREILAAAGSDAELVGVPDADLPADLFLTKALSQHLLVDASRARSLLGWADRDPVAALRASVAWHLAHPPADTPDLSADDRALAAA